jgi:hypothetical protein
MLEELRRRNYAESTIGTYIRTVEHFSRYFHRPPDQLGPEHIREYQAALFTRWKLASNTVTQRLAALRSNTYQDASEADRKRSATDQRRTIKRLDMAFFRQSIDRANWRFAAPS